MTKVREKQLQKRKQETIETALRLLTERGYANLNMDELAEEVGISKPTLYQYFNSKDELLAQAFVYMMEKTEAQILENSELSPMELLEKFLRSTFESAVNERHIMTQIDFEVMRTIIHRYPYVKEHFAQVRQKLAVVVERGQAQGEIDPTIPGWVMLNFVMSLQRTINNPFMKDAPHRSEEEINEGIESVIRMFKRSVSVEIPLAHTES
jgi:AcrR family transcriptional regulator